VLFISLANVTVLNVSYEPAFDGLTGLDTCRGNLGGIYLPEHAL